MFFKITGNKGMTLVELLVSIVILSAVMAIATALFLRVQMLNDRYEKKYRVEAEVSRAVRKMEKDLKTSRGLLWSTGQSVSFLGIDGDSLEYRLTMGSLYFNHKPLLGLSVKSMHIEFFCGGDTAVPRAVLDKDGSDGLDRKELSCIKGIYILLSFDDGTRDGMNRILKKDFFVCLRNRRL